MTLGFMHFSFIRQSKDLKKKKKINMVNFLFEKRRLFVCMCALVCVLLNVSMFVYML